MELYCAAAGHLQRGSDLVFVLFCLWHWLISSWALQIKVKHPKTGQLVTKVEKVKPPNATTTSGLALDIKTERSIYGQPGIIHLTYNSFSISPGVVLIWTGFTGTSSTSVQNE
jgi:hypothetical protein